MSLKFNVYTELCHYVARNCLNFEGCNTWNNCQILIKSIYKKDFFIRIKFYEGFENFEGCVSGFFDEKASKKIMCVCDYEFGQEKNIAFAVQVSKEPKANSETDFVCLLCTETDFLETIKILLDLQLDKFKAQFRKDY